MKIATRLTIEDARILIDGATKHASAIGVPMCIAVVDEGGQLVSFDRMEGGKITSTTIAIDKAFTSAGARRGTHEVGQACQPGAPAYGLNTAIGGRMMAVGGGLPVVWKGDTIGGIGVSSGSPAQDQDVAQAGLDHWLAKQG